MPTPLTIALVLAAAGTAAANQMPPPSGPRPPILRSSGDTVRVRLLDAHSGAAIANTGVAVSSDNGIRCVTAPCPTNALGWTGKTDAMGTVVVPSNVLQASTRITTAAHVLASLIDEAEENNGIWVVELVPKDLIDSSDRVVHAFKLIDASTNNAIANAELRVFVGAGSGFDARTTPLGYLFISDEKIHSDFDRVWVVVPGYQRTRLEYGAGVRHKTRLNRREGFVW